MQRPLPETEGGGLGAPDSGGAHAAFLADQTKVAGLREIAGDSQARVERLCLSGHGVELVMRAARIEGHVQTAPAVQLGGCLLEVLGRQDATLAFPPDEEKRLFLRRGPLQVFSQSRWVGPAWQRPGTPQVEAFNPSEDDRMNSIEVRNAEGNLSRSGFLRTSLAIVLAAILVVFLAVCLSL